ncbi:MAG: hypothetical protein AB1646_15090 [Thermodesulfobacteriota bacterium]
MGPLRIPDPLRLGVLLAAMALLTGCQELQITLDNLLGKEAIAASPSREDSSSRVILAQQQAPPTGVRRPPGRPAPGAATPGEQPSPAARPTPPGQAPRAGATEDGKKLPEGKKRPPGRYSPAAGPIEAREMPAEFALFRGRENPFDPPTEVGPPSECPPSRPLCRFDRSQLKLVGIIQVGEGQFKGLVEDPDGRGYFVGAGMQIGNATVTQITYKGITLQEHKFGGKDVLIPLYSRSGEGGEF